MEVLVEDPQWCQQHWKYSTVTLLLSKITFCPFSVNFQIQTQIWVFTCAFQDRACYSKQEGTRRRQHQAMEPSCSQTLREGNTARYQYLNDENAKMIDDVGDNDNGGTCWRWRKLTQQEQQVQPWRALRASHILAPTEDKIESWAMNAKNFIYERCYSVAQYRLTNWNHTFFSICTTTGISGRGHLWKWKLNCLFWVV